MAQIIIRNAVGILSLNGPTVLQPVPTRVKVIAPRLDLFAELTITVPKGEVCEVGFVQGCTFARCHAYYQTGEWGFRLRDDLPRPVADSVSENDLPWYDAKRSMKRFEEGRETQCMVNMSDLPGAPFDTRTIAEQEFVLEDREIGGPLFPELQEVAALYSFKTWLAFRTSSSETAGDGFGPFVGGLEGLVLYKWRTGFSVSFERQPKRGQRLAYHPSQVRWWIDDVSDRLGQPRTTFPLQGPRRQIPLSAYSPPTALSPSASIRRSNRRHRDEPPKRDLEYEKEMQRLANEDPFS